MPVALPSTSWPAAAWLYCTVPVATEVISPMLANAVVGAVMFVITLRISRVWLAAALTVASSAPWLSICTESVTCVKLGTTPG